MRTRKDIEALEDQFLAPYAMHSKDTEDRVIPEPPHETRTCYQRDRDRIVHSEAFRKLEYKTQVFVIFEGDYYRTRLTHTIEVAQIARSIGRCLCLNEDLIEAIALAHDLGHPPFGHAGELALNNIMEAAGKRLNKGKSRKIKLEFNHNRRSFDIVTLYEKRYPEFNGLNLTSEVLVGILKHNTIYDKAGYAAQFENTGTTLEAQVVDAADSIAYLAHDIDDGLNSGCIVKEDLMESALWEQAYNKIHPTLEQENKEMLKYQIAKFLIDMQVKDLLQHAQKALDQHRFKNSFEVKVYNLRNSNKRLISFSPTMNRDRNYLQDLLNTKLYHHYRVERMTAKAKRIIHDLFEVYLSNPSQLPYEVYDRSKKHALAEQYQIICHYIASMTDRYALDEHKKLFNPYQKV